MSSVAFFIIAIPMLAAALAAAGFSAPPSHSRRPALRIDAPRPLSTYVRTTGVV